mmetsp:Transcript_40835/g.71820  ORF Transcript_40835/g.71820 Transcript_40835/m.71820 type:complete len:82 (+) Transcript_40835:442-687(+)
MASFYAPATLRKRCFMAEALTSFEAGAFLIAAAFRLKAVCLRAFLAFLMGSIARVRIVTLGVGGYGTVLCVWCLSLHLIAY